jgi:hypothetical protein
MGEVGDINLQHALTSNKEELREEDPPIKSWVQLFY